MSDPFLDSSYYNNQARTLHSHNQHQKAEISFARALQKRKTNHAGIYNNWGIILNQQAKFQKACAKYIYALQIHPFWANLHGRWGFSLLYLGKFDEALEKFEEASRLNPSYFIFQANISLVMFLKGERLEAEELLNDQIEDYWDPSETKWEDSEAYNFYMSELENQKKRLEKMNDEEVERGVRGIEWIVEILSKRFAEIEGEGDEDEKEFEGFE